MAWLQWPRTSLSSAIYNSFMLDRPVAKNMKGSPGIDATMATNGTDVGDFVK